MTYLHRKDIKLIDEIMDKFPDAQVLRLDYTHGSGIDDHTLKLTLTTKVFGKDADVTFEIAGAADW